jgi:hypothetical protein
MHTVAAAVACNENTGQDSSGRKVYNGKNRRATRPILLFIESEKGEQTSEDKIPQS